MARRRDSGQVLVVAALAMTALLAFTALVFNVGAFLVERRGLQNAADAAALAAARRMLDEQATRSFQDDQVAREALRLANMNGADVGGSRQMEALYLDGGGAVLAAVGATGRFPATASGVRITIWGPYASILGAFLGGATIQASATAKADVRPSPFPNTWTNPVPIGVPLAAFQAGAAFDLYDQTTAERSYGVSDYRPFLDLANDANTGTGYSAGASYGGDHINLQYWSDGGHESGVLAIGTSIVLAGDDFAPDVRTGLLDNVRRQRLIDADGAAYALVVVPLWDTHDDGGGSNQQSVTIAGFATFKILASNIGAASLPGHFVPYVPDSAAVSLATGPAWGPSIARLSD